MTTATLAAPLRQSGSFFAMCLDTMVQRLVQTTVWEIDSKYK